MKRAASSANATDVRISDAVAAVAVVAILQNNFKQLFNNSLCSYAGFCSKAQ